jgi:hypothetical protein
MSDNNDQSPASRASVPPMVPHWPQRMDPGGSKEQPTPVTKTPRLFFNFIYSFRESYTLTAGTPASIDVWIAAVRLHLSQTLKSYVKFFFHLIVLLNAFVFFNSLLALF